mgnify:CR=1 FL=1
MASSPRERGSSQGRDSLHSDRVVVPARAGVIPWDRAPDARAACRPRASGGHPRPDTLARPVAESSPRERGSSVVDAEVVGHAQVVPARAGVIPAA